MPDEPENPEKPDEESEPVNENVEPDGTAPQGIVFQLPGFMDPATLQHQQDMHNMAAVTWRHDVRDFMMSLSLEQARTFRNMLNMLDNLADPESSISYWLGLATGIIDIKYSICNGCGLDHDDELRKQLEGGTDGNAG